MNWLTKTLIPLCLAAGLSVPAQAASHFKVTNNLDQKIDVAVFDGGDKVCLSPRSTGTLEAGETKEFHCREQGNELCKVDVTLGKKGGHKRVCGGLYKACGRNAMRVKNGAVLTVNSTAKKDCTIE